ncbi:MAG: AtpZ/AtpI family protein [Bacteroidia bacterium]
MDKEKPQNPKKLPLTDPSSGTKNYARYSSMGFQMAAIIGIGIFAGIKLDAYFSLKKFPAFTVSLSLFSIIAAIYFVIREVTKK